MSVKSKRLRRAVRESRSGKPLSDAAGRGLLGMYQRSLKFPRTRPRRQFLLCPVGLVGSGKTTVLKPLSRRLHLLRISSDELRALLVASGKNLVRTRELMLTLIEKYLRRGYSVAVDADCATPLVRRRLETLALRFRIKICWIHITAPEAFILRKLRRLKYGWLFQNARQAVAVYRIRKALHEHLAFPFFYTFETSRRNLPAQIAEAAARMKQRFGAG